MANDINVNKITTSGQERWDVSYTVDGSGEVSNNSATISKTLKTAGTLLDRNIKISIITPLLPATTYNVSTSNQIIAAGKYISGAQTIRGVTTENIDAANIKTGITVKVGDAGSATRIKNVTGTFTASNTVTSGQTAATAAQVLSGYSAWVDGAEVKGSIANATATGGIPTLQKGSMGNMSLSSSDIVGTVPSGYYINLVASGGSRITGAGFINEGSLPYGSKDFYIKFPTAVISCSPGADSSFTLDSSGSTTLGWSFESANNTSGAVIGITSICKDYYNLLVRSPGYITNLDITSSGLIRNTELTKNIYIRSIKINKPSSGSKYFKIIVPNNTGWIDFIFNVAANGNVSVTTSSNSENLYVFS